MLFAIGAVLLLLLEIIFGMEIASHRTCQYINFSSIVYSYLEQSFVCAFFSLSLFVRLFFFCSVQFSARFFSSLRLVWYYFRCDSFGIHFQANHEMQWICWWTIQPSTTLRIAFQLALKRLNVVPHSKRTLLQRHVNEKEKQIERTNVRTNELTNEKNQ